MDLITTIEEDAEVENLSEDSDAEVEVSNHNFVLVPNVLIFTISSSPSFSTSQQS